MKDKFLLVSLDDDQSKDLAQVLSNKTSRKILDLLAEKKATESAIAKKLGSPLSTVHYNLKQLVKAKLVEVKEFHYSEKGKEVNHYSLANKTVIIAPKQSHAGLMEKLKSLVPAFILVGAVGFAMNILDKAQQGTTVMVQKAMAAVPETAVAEVAEAARAVPMMADSAEVAQAAPVAAEKMMETLPFAPSEPNVLWWFLGGVVLFINFYLIIDYMRNRWKK